MKPILYLGDTSLSSAAAYLAGLMHLWKWPFQYAPSDRSLSAGDLQQEHSLFVISDYPAARIDDALQERIVEQVAAGAGLLMIGGWETFQGLGGGWHGSILSQILPVVISSSDDRVNADQPLVARVARDHAIVADLPFDVRPPIVGGYNRLTPKQDAHVILELDRYCIHRSSDGFTFAPDGPPAPLLVVGRHGAGRSAAFASDAAPHWVGPLIDWGPRRVLAQAPGAEAIEVGSDYARFFRQLLSWTGAFGDS